MNEPREPTPPPVEQPPAEPLPQSPASEPVIVREEEPQLSQPPKTSARSGPKWQMEARERLRSAIRKFGKPLNDLLARDANEGDTRLLVTDFLREGFGFDTYEDLTTEYQVRGEFADYGVRIDGELIAFIEVKRVKTKLAAKQLRQVEMYAVNEGVEWAVLTNGAQWQVFHLGNRTPIEIDLAMDVDLLDEAKTLAQKTDELFYLTRDSMKRGQIDELWQARRATAPKSLANVLVSDPVAEAIRKELRRNTGQRVERSEIQRLIRETVIRSECFD
jgi:Type I restriction enzyme R protein N terminus (HSDR_N)